MYASTVEHVCVILHENVVAQLCIVAHTGVEVHIDKYAATASTAVVKGCVSRRPCDQNTYYNRIIRCRLQRLCDVHIYICGANRRCGTQNHWRVHARNL